MKMIMIILVAIALFIDVTKAQDASVSPSFRDREFSIVDFGAKAGDTKCTEAIAAAFAAAEKAGGGRILVPEGRWFSGAIRFKSNCELHLSDGAEILFSQDPADYLPAVHTSWEGIECWNYCPLVYAYCCTNVAITGTGTLKAYEGEWEDTFWYPWVWQENGIRAARRQLYDWSAQNYPVGKRQIWKKPNAHTRPHLLQLNRCKGIRLEGFKVRNSPFWTIHLYHSEDAVVRGLDVFAHGNNNDGIDIEMTRNVLVEDCRFDQGDDGIVIKSGRNQDAWRLARPTEDVLVRNCEVVNGHGLLVVGSEISGGVRNVMVENSKCGNVHRVFYIKTNRRRGGTVENICMKDCTAQNVDFAAVCVETDVLYEWAEFPTYDERLTAIRNLQVDNVTCEKVKHPVYLVGERESPVESVRVNWLNVKSAEVESVVENVNGYVYVPKPPNDEDIVSQNRTTIFFAGDSTLDDYGESRGSKGRPPYASWGTALREFLAPHAQVWNFAQSGHSTKMFIECGQWGRLIREVRAGDFVVIQFGHNDQKHMTVEQKKTLFAPPETDYRTNLRRFAAEVRAKGATPVFCTPIVRATFDKEGSKLVDTTWAGDGINLGSYVKAVIATGKELGVDVVDMNKMTGELCERLGPEGACKFYVISTGVEFAKDGEPSKDVTHPVKTGAAAFARLFADDARARELGISKLMKQK